MPLKVYRSSAGSGKTTTLVNEYLEMLMKPDGNFKSILAITFTNKASAEMKERILKVLSTIADCTDKNTLNPSLLHQVSEIEKLYNLPFSTIRAKASAQLTQILHQYGSFAVSTIDKFTHQIIRSFAFDLRVPSNFVVETDTELVVRNAVDHLINRIGENELITKLMVEFMLERIDEEKSYRIEEDLVALGKLMYNEKGLPMLPLLSDLSAEDFIKLRGNFFSSLAIIQKGFSDKAEELQLIAKKAGLLPTDFSHGYSGYFGAIVKLSIGDINGFDSKRFNDAVESGNFYAKTAAKEVKEKFSGVESILVTKSTALQDYWLANKEEYFLLKIMLRNFYSLALLKEIKWAIDDLRHSEGVLPIAEFNHLVASAIAKEPAPFIYERIGNRYSELCIDEFQDTSVKQWENLMPLAENVLSMDGTVLLVGDSKQSIYRFRGGEANQLNALPEILYKEYDWMQEREFLFRQHFLPRSLNYNYRSKSEIIDFNNAFFRHVISNCLPQANKDFPVGTLEKLFTTYSDVEQECGKKKGGGSVRVQIIEEVESKGGTKGEDLMQERILALKNQIDYYVGLGFRWRDITILTRANKEAGQFAAGLLDYGINVISRESVRVNESYKVVLLMDALRWFEDASNESARLNVLNYLSLQSKNQAVPHHYFSDKVIWHDLLKNLSLEWAPEEWNFLPMPSLVKRLMHFFNLDSGKDVFLSFFLESVVNFYQKVKGGLREFIQWWNDHGDRLNIVIPEGIDAVQLMTVHKSKGLQFKVVIMPMADWETKVGRGKKHWLKLNPKKNFGLALAVSDHSQDLLNTAYADTYREEEFENLVDHLNLFYVAFTRAEEHLALVVYEKKNSAMNTWLQSFLAKSNLLVNNSGVYIYGNAAKNQPSEKLVPDEALLQHQTSYATRDLIMDYRWAFPIEGEEIQSLELGLLVHSLFSKVKTKSDLPFVAEKIITINPVWKEKILEMVEWAQQELLLSSMWDEQYEIRNEQDILLLDGKSARPDRLMILGKKAKIYDYKTGIQRESHNIQLREYATVLMQMGFQIEALVLVYVELRQVVQVQ
jgi:ATP-dependent exoDNAse (exonuclease V) beta subunit